MIKERRKRTRVPAGFELTIDVHGKEAKVKTVNVSLTGVSCEQNALFHLNDPCHVIIRLNQDTSLNIEGKILRVDDREAIISFLSMDEETFYHLKRLVLLNSRNPDKIEQEIEQSAFDQKTGVSSFPHNQA